MPRLILLCCILLLPAHAQLDYRSPDIAPDGTVTFRLKAPAATAVTLQGIPDHTDTALTRDATGIWTVTLGPLAPDIYSYWFDVDGARVVDPRNRHIKAWLQLESAFEVVGDASRPFALRDVPHGTIHRHTYHSPVRDGAATAYLVYTPPGYDPRGTTRYPVVFLLHGFGDDERAWHEYGRAHLIADNLIAAGTAVPTIVVMPHGHPAPLPYGQADRSPYWAVNQARMERQIIDEILPQIDAAYLTRPDRDHRAIAGLSMGGGHALGIGNNNLDTFGWIGGFSSGGTTRGFADLLATRLEHDAPPAPHLLWIACGEDDFLIETNRELIAWLTAHDIPHTYVESTGAHRWPVWRDYWERFLPLLFQP